MDIGFQGLAAIIDCSDFFFQLGQLLFPLPFGLLQTVPLCGKALGQLPNHGL